MPCRRRRPFIVVLMALLLLSGCVPSLRNAVVDVRASVEPSATDRAYKALTVALLEKGFDIKIRNPDQHIITTEYLKVAEVSGFPPFDFYLQIKAMVKEISGGGAELALWPKMKEQNRFNQNAFTEHPLIVYEPKDVPTLSSRSEAMQKGQVVFQSLVQAVAEALGPAAGPFKHTTNQIEVLGM